MIRIGFWKENEQEANVFALVIKRLLGESLPDPRAWVDPYWEHEERVAVVRYLRAAPIVDSCFGYSYCRMCGWENGCSERSDGTYLWPDGFAHYLTDHGVCPPEEFVQHVLSHMDRVRMWEERSSP